MKTNVLLFFAALYFAFLLPCHARLGETEEESIKRYGPPESDSGLSNGCKTLVFRVSDVRVEAEFYKGICVDLIFTRPGGPFTVSELKEIVTQNSEGKTWDLSPLDTYKPGGEVCFLHRNDGGRAGITLANMIDISSPAAKDFNAASKAGEEQKEKEEAKKTTSGL